jgi:hypothetical protein
MKTAPLGIFRQAPSLLAFAALSALTLSFAHADELVLQDGKILAAFDSESGALTRLENKITHW